MLGYTAGAMAWRQAIHAAMEGIPLEEAAKTKPELKAAIYHWGIPKRLRKRELQNQELCDGYPDSRTCLFSFLGKFNSVFFSLEPKQFLNLTKR
jgi:hypothetical protein